MSLFHTIVNIYVVPAILINHEKIKGVYALNVKSDLIKNS